ncbi:MAG TPA: DMT family transporter [Actinophytocola sp.]|uniref:DMT family transporter n=1 Tax=Actinophytocola sp. TaxID=1872138 RepID=UPI002DB5B05C|nr:DMT family transporter [Actinophytocola sp.]HEU5473929.1 DMT family transporter [Actinophytocola sp.]
MPTAPPHPTAHRVAGASVAALGGACLAVQGRVNGELGHLLGDGVYAGVISTGIGLAVLVAWVAVLPAARRGAARLVRAVRTGRLRWWQCLGGAIGGVVVGSQGIVVPTLGVAVFSVALVGGMVVSGLMVDRLGVGPGDPTPVTAPRVAGAVLAVAAVVLAVSPRFGHPSGLWLAVLPALAGIGIAWQVALNGLVRREADNVIVPTMVNFATGLAVLLIALVVDVLVRGVPGVPPGKWWLYAGGPLGIVAVLTAVVAVRLVGVLLVGLASVAGQLVAAVVLDVVAPTAGGGLTVAGVAGAALTMVAVGIAALRLEGWVRDRDDPGRQGNP